MLLLIDKPAGLTSHDVVDRVRRIFKTRRVGHAGTLDPFATGLLILGVDKATKELGSLSGLDKSYEVTAELGATSDTFDVEGARLVTDPSTFTIPTTEGIERVLGHYRGDFDQKAPIFSAKKINGKKLYELARAGTATEDMRPVKRITISQLDILEYVWPVLRLTVTCSSGTYIRTLVDDIGRDLGCGAFATALRRTSIGTYTIDQAKTLADLAPQTSS